MLKNILNLEGAKRVTKNEQKTIKGGVPVCFKQCGEAGGVPDREHHGQCICY